MPDKVDIWALGDLCTPWCIHVAATLGIAGHIAGGITRIEDLAAASGAVSDSLIRVLRHLVNKGVFEEPSPGCFALNEPALALLDSTARIGFDLTGIGGRMAYAWGTLLNAVKTGAPAYDSIFRVPFWEDLKANPDIGASFDSLMGPAGHGAPDPDVQISGGWESVRRIVDVGGGTGALLASILRAHADVRGILVDLPQTIDRSKEIFQAAGVADRATAVALSFFDPLPSGADLYLLKSVLSDWPDREALLILKICAEAARPAGRVVILNGVVPDSDYGPSPELLTMVLVGGKSRTVTEFQELAHEAGLEIIAAGPQPSGRFVVECRPAPSSGRPGTALA